MRKERIEELIKFHRDGLLNDTVPFWMKHTIDRECGGYLNHLDRDGTVINTDKPVWLLGRFAWLTADRLTGFTIHRRGLKTPSTMASWLLWSLPPSGASTAKRWNRVC